MTFREASPDTLEAPSAAPVDPAEDREIPVQVEDEVEESPQAVAEIGRAHV